MPTCQSKVEHNPYNPNQKSVVGFYLKAEKEKYLKSVSRLLKVTDSKTNLKWGSLRYKLFKSSKSNC